MASRSGRLQLETALIPDESRIQPVICAANDMLLAPAAAEKHQLVLRLQRKLGISAAEARNRVMAYKQFLSLKAATLDIDATKLSPPPLIDRVWHEHVLDTKRYAPACLSAFGHPIHHDPNGDADVPARARRRAATLVALKKCYPDNYDEEIWAFPAEAPHKRKRAVVKREGTPASRTRRRTMTPSDDKLNISVRDANGTVLPFLIKPTTPLERLFNAFATSKGVAVMDLHFLFDGSRVRRDQTPADIGMGDGDQIDCMRALQGC